MSEQQQAWLLDEQFKQEFLDECKLAATDDEAFSRFRSMNRIHTVIENNTEEYKQKMLPLIEDEFTDEGWLKFSSSDNHGTAGMPETTFVENYVTPDTVKYVYIMNLIDKLFSSDPIFDIVEIGAGYGGQCKILYDMGMFKEYTIYDLPEVQLLQKRFLNNFGINPIFKELPEEVSGGNLCLSWVAWAELSRDMKIEYYNKVISKCDRYFIGSNYNVEEDREILSSNGEQYREYSDSLYAGITYWSKYW